MEPNQGVSLDANTVIEVQKQRIAQLEWELTVATARALQAEASVSDLMKAPQNSDG